MTPIESTFSLDVNTKLDWWVKVRVGLFSTNCFLYLASLWKVNYFPWSICLVITHGLKSWIFTS